LKKILISKSSDYEINFFANESLSNPSLIFIFSSFLGNSNLSKSLIDNLLSRYGFDVIEVNSIHKNVFQSIPPSIFEEINTTVSPKKYEDKVGFGSLIGGYAAIAFSKLFELNQVIVFSPQLPIENLSTTLKGKYERSKVLRYLITPNSIHKECRYSIFYGDEIIDEKHLKIISEPIFKASLDVIKLPYSKLPDLEVLQKYVNLVVKINKMNADSVYEKSLFLDRLGKLDESLFAINLAISKDDKVSKFHRHKSAVLDRMHHLKEAIQAIQPAIKLNPNIAEYFAHQSSLLLRLNKLNESLIAINLAISKDDKVSKFHRHKSAVLDRMNLLKEAIQAIQPAIKLDPNIVEYYIHKSSLLERMGKLHDSIDSVLEILKANKNNKVARDRLKYLVDKRNSRKFLYLFKDFF